MNLDKAVMLFAAFVVLTSLALAHWVHPAWIWLTVFAGANLAQASVTGFCPAIAFRRLGLRPGQAFR
ncbi:DUF2892 domain-containing protein [Brevundimonas sp.]|uniref:YgaP family membrane protein n=1 Tax=Brevundimonas sp. TaxID=1871086 RepID=UPI002EDB4CF9